MSKRIRTGLYAGGRLEKGAAVLAAADAIDNSLVKQRIAPFAQANEGYAEAHAAVTAAEAHLEACQQLLDELDDKQDSTLEALACALVGDAQQSRHNPFAGFGVAAPGRVKKLKYGEKAQAIHRLAGAIHKETARESASHRAAAAADKAARSMETALQPVETLQAAVVTARHARALAGKRWDAELTAFKCAARAAAPDGSLSKALFGQRPDTKKPADTPTPAPVADVPAPLADTPVAAAAAGAPAAGTAVPSSG